MADSCGLNGDDRSGDEDAVERDGGEDWAGSSRFVCEGESFVTSKIRGER